VPPPAAVADALARALAPLTRADGPVATAATDRLGRILWDRAGLRRDASGLQEAAAGMAALREEQGRVGAPGPRAQNGPWQDALDLDSRLTLAEAVIAAATARTESRGVHLRTDHPAPDDAAWLRSVVVRSTGHGLATTTMPIALDRVPPHAPAPPAATPAR
jgi:succinate dehydrogenase/fumarate reductase flavoprotein subunit